MTNISIQPDPIPKVLGAPRTGTLVVDGVRTPFCGDRDCSGGCGLPQLHTAKDPSFSHLGNAQEGYQWAHYEFYVTIRLGVSPVLEYLGSRNREHPREYLTPEIRDALYKRTWW